MSRVKEQARYILKTMLPDLEALQSGSYWELHDRILDALEQAILSAPVADKPVFGENHLD